MADDWTYVVTDIETDGPWPGANSMRSFASVATRADGTIVGEFEAVLEPLPGSAPNPQTYAWFQSLPPEAWAAATEGARPIPHVMADFVAWVKGLGEKRVFAASPLIFDGMWIDFYLRRFTPFGVLQGPYETDRLFAAPALCLRSYFAAVTGTPVAEIPPTDRLPEGWLGEVAHSHRAIDDSRGYAHLLAMMFSKAGALRPN